MKKKISIPSVRCLNWKNTILSFRKLNDFVVLRKVPQNLPLASLYRFNRVIDTFIFSTKS
jgi:hypothetical protein